MSEHFILFLIGQAAMGIGVYAAIRADLREALVRVGTVERRIESLESNIWHESRGHQ